ncbi:hypothetical protein [Neisseria sp. Ec49-e6-T10]|uniref:hypothetical protein n=1 Tax=Neisseria sp. Ec49-e6-T10 TaxID=3140744 RepID=UPI003EBC11E5
MNTKNRVSSYIRNWAAWNRDVGKIGQTCCSFERHFANDPERHKWEEDIERRLSFRYDAKIANKAEQLIIQNLSKTEIRVLVACEVYGHNMALKTVARIIEMPLSTLETYRDAAFYKLGVAING